MAGFPDALRQKHCIAVGGNTADAARAAGFTSVEVAMGDASSVAAACLAKMPHGSRILYPCGRVRRPELEAALSASGIGLIAVETYDTAVIRIDDAARFHAEAVLVHSVLSVEALRMFLADHPNALPDGFRCLCLSQRIADAAGRLKGARIEAAREPSDAALIALLTTAG